MLTHKLKINPRKPLKGKRGLFVVEGGGGGSRRWIEENSKKSEKKNMER